MLARLPEGRWNLKLGTTQLDQFSMSCDGRSPAKNHPGHGGNLPGTGQLNMASRFFPGLL